MLFTADGDIAKVFGLAGLDGDIFNPFIPLLDADAFDSKNVIGADQQRCFETPLGIGCHRGSLLPKSPPGRMQGSIFAPATGIPSALSSRPITVPIGCNLTVIG